MREVPERERTASEASPDVVHAEGNFRRGEPGLPGDAGQAGDSDHQEATGLPIPDCGEEERGSSGRAKVWRGEYRWAGSRHQSHTRLLP